MKDPGGLVLYGTSACHLCEIAAAILQEMSLPYDEVDIAGSDELFERYGVRIPVLRTADGRELGWPFDAPMVTAFLSA